MLGNTDTMTVAVLQIKNHGSEKRQSLSGTSPILGHSPSSVETESHLHWDGSVNFVDIWVLETLNTGKGLQIHVCIK